MKKLKLRIAKFDKMLVVEQLELDGEFKRTNHVKVDGDLFLFEDYIDLQENIDDISANCLEFDDNAERDEYAANLIKWITEEQFGGCGKLEVGKPCLVRDEEDGRWAERIYAGKVAKQLGMDKRYLTHSESEEDVFLRWRYAKPINDSLKVDGEIYTWETEESAMNNEELKPCPFCGGEAEIVEDSLFGEDYYAGRCRSCAATSIFEFTKEEAVAAWNRRYTPEQKDFKPLILPADALDEATKDGIRTGGKLQIPEVVETGNIWYLRKATEKDLWENFQRISELLSDIKESLQVGVKPLEWQDEDNRDVACAWICANFYFKAKGCGECYLVKADNHGKPISSMAIRENGIESLEMQKRIAEAWLKDIVAAALGIGRSEGKK